MYLLCAAEDLTGFSLIWRAKDTPASRLLWALGRSEHRTSGIGSGSWVTPTRENTKRPNNGTGDNLLMQVDKSWPTPRAEDTEQTCPHLGTPDTLTSAARTQWTTPTRHDGQHGMQSEARATDPAHLGQCLQYDVLRKWPTPNQTDTKGPSQPEGRRPTCDDDLPSRVVGQAAQENPSTLGKPRGSLNGQWVAQLMNWPEEFTAELTRLYCEYAATGGATRTRC
jgi:hypothetical protein